MTKPSYCAGSARQVQITGAWCCSSWVARGPGWPSLSLLVDVLVNEVGGLHETVDAAAVKTLTFELVGQHATVLRLLQQSIGNLNLTILARRCALDNVENVRGRNVAADNSQVAGRIFRDRKSTRLNSSHVKI